MSQRLSSPFLVSSTAATETTIVKAVVTSDLDVTANITAATASIPIIAGHQRCDAAHHRRNVRDYRCTSGEPDG
jgi:hypothetical protein